LFQIESKQATPLNDTLFPNPWSIDDIRWEDDSSRFTFLYNQRGHQVVRILAVNGQTGETGILIDEASKTFVDYAHKLYSFYLDQTHEVIWMSERSGWNHLYLINALTGQVIHPITQGEWVVRSVDFVDVEKRQIWFQASGVYPEQDPYYLHYCRIDFDGKNFTLLTAGNGTHEAEFSPDRKFLVDTYSRVDMAPVTELRSAIDGKLITVLETAAIDPLVATGWQIPERFSAKGRDGQTDIYGVIYRPSTFDPKLSYPILESIYAGPHGSHVPKGFSAFRREQEIAELGFIIVQIDGMGTSNRSKAFHDVCWKNLGDSGFPDRVLWIQAAAKKYPYMDLNRVGLYGGSAGGQSTVRGLLAHGDFYKVGVADCGCHDNRMDKVWWNELWMSYPIDKHYDEQSNVTQAHRLTGKLMLVVGELDDNVDPASTMQVVNALVKADKDFELLIIPGVGHGAAESPYGHRRRKDFLVRNLLGVEPRHP
jgi:dipeptidyl aminopeptidase/acylaminoacyl peptidase